MLDVEVEELVEVEEELDEVEEEVEVDELVEVEELVEVDELVEVEEEVEVDDEVEVEELVEVDEEVDVEELVEVDEDVEVELVLVVVVMVTHVSSQPSGFGLFDVPGVAPGSHCSRLLWRMPSPQYVQASGPLARQVLVPAGGRFAVN